MAKGASRVELNRQALDELDLRMAHGLEALAIEVLETVRVPDAPEYGVGLVDQGGFISYVDGKRVGFSDSSIRKPKGFAVRGKGAGVAVGFGFPGRFVETGTEHSAARPFLAPATMSVVGSASTVEHAMRAAFATRMLAMQRRNIRYRTVRT